MPQKDTAVELYVKTPPKVNQIYVHVAKWRVIVTLLVAKILKPIALIREEVLVILILILLHTQNRLCKLYLNIIYLLSGITEYINTNRSLKPDWNSPITLGEKRTLNISSHWFLLSNLSLRYTSSWTFVPKKNWVYITSTKTDTTYPFLVGHWIYYCA